VLGAAAPEFEVTFMITHSSKKVNAPRAKKALLALAFFHLAQNALPRFRQGDEKED
jgi:hypothetical protein